MMTPESASRLIALNHQFYQTFSADFSATRQRPQPGVLRALAGLSPEASILDLGCGNGLLARWLAERWHRGAYMGLDFSERLLAVARAALKRHPDFNARFELLDLTLLASDPEVDEDSQVASENEGDTNFRLHFRMGSSSPVFPGFDRVFAFAVLHHLPGEEARLAALRAVRAVLNPEGQAVLSNWQFLTDQKLRSRIVPWAQIGLSSGEIDPGDYLLDWRRGGLGYRYVHQFSEVEIVRLAAASGLRVVEHLYSDGKSGTLNLYTWLRRA